MIPPIELINSMSDRTLDVFFQGMVNQTDPATVMSMVEDIIKDELSKHNVPYVETQVKEMSATLGLEFLRSLEMAMDKVGRPANDESYTVH